MRSWKVLLVAFGVVCFCAGLAAIGWFWLRSDQETPPKMKFSTPQGGVNALAYSPSGLHVAVATGDAVAIYDRATGQPIQLLTGRREPGFVRSLAYSPDGRLLVTAASNGDLTVWDAERMVLRQTFQEGRNEGEFGPKPPNSTHFTCVSFSPDGQTIAVGALDGGVALWDVATGRQVQFARHRCRMFSLAFSPDGRVLATGDENASVQFWDTTTWATTREFGKLCTYTFSLAFNFDGDLACGGAWSGEHEPVRLWDRKTDRFRPFPGGEHDGWDVLVAHVAFSPDGQTLAVAEQTKRRPRHRIRLFNVPSGNVTGAITCSERVNVVAFSSDGREIAAGCGYPDRSSKYATHVRIWSLPNP